MDSILSLPKGVYNDRIITAEERIVDLGWRSNIVVDRCRYLLAAFMKGDGAAGIQFLAVGRGEAAWDDQPPSAPVSATEQLVNPAPITIPVEAGHMEFLDAAGTPTAGPTNRIQIVVTLDPGMPPVEGGETTYPLREFGLFGTFAGENYMIDYVRHPVIHKQAEDILVRTIQLIF